MHQTPVPLRPLREIREGMRFVSGAPWEHSGCSCRTDGNEVTIRPGGKLNQQVGLREMLEDYAWRSVSVFANEHRRKAPTWGPPRIPECMEAPDPFPSVCI